VRLDIGRRISLHRQAEAGAYFGVARIGSDQLRDYAARFGIGVDANRLGLRSNLEG